MLSKAVDFLGGILPDLMLPDPMEHDQPRNTRESPGDGVGYHQVGKCGVMGENGKDPHKTEAADRYHRDHHGNNAVSQSAQRRKGTLLKTAQENRGTEILHPYQTPFYNFRIIGEHPQKRFPEEIKSPSGNEKQ